MSEILQLDKADFETQIIEATIASQAGKGISKCLNRKITIKGNQHFSVMYTVLSHDQEMHQTNDLEIAINSFNRQSYKKEVKALKDCRWVKAFDGHYNISCPSGERANRDFKGGTWDFTYCPYCSGKIEVVES